MEESYSFGHWGSTSEEILRTQFPLHRACRDGDVDALSELLIQAQHGIFEEDSFYGWTPAHWAAYFGKLGCVRKLLTLTRVGVNCNIRTSRFLQTPAHLAAFGGHPQCLLWLVQSKADVELQDYLGETAVHKAGRTGSIECVSLLASHGATLHTKNNNNHTPAEVAAMCGFPECSRYLRDAAQQQLQNSPAVYHPSISSSSSDAFITKTPSPHDITAHKVEPCVITQGLNAGRLPPPTPQNSEECEMEEEEPPGAAAITPALNAASDTTVQTHQNTDVTLDGGVSRNQVTVAGRKRCREDTDEADFKRMRTSDGAWNGALTIPPHQKLTVVNTGVSGLSNGHSVQQSCGVQNGHNDQTVHYPQNGHNLLSSHDYQNTAHQNGHQLQNNSTDIDFDDCVGYDYNGIPQFESKSFSQGQSVHLSMDQSQDMETEKQAPPRCRGLFGHMV